MSANNVVAPSGQTTNSSFVNEPLSGNTVAKQSKQKLNEDQSREDFKKKIAGILGMFTSDPEKQLAKERLKIVSQIKDDAFNRFQEIKQNIGDEFQNNLKNARNRIAQHFLKGQKVNEF